MIRPSFSSALLGLLALVGSVDAATRPYTVTWSETSHGPDGPWQAITVKVGSKNQAIDLYPGDKWDSSIFLDQICDNKTLSEICYAERAGTFNMNASTTETHQSESPWMDQTWNVPGQRRFSALADRIDFGRKVDNVSISALYDTYQTYPNGRAYPVSVGTLSLGAPQRYHTTNGKQMNMITAGLYFAGGGQSIPSYSYGMHIGSVNAKIDGSLVLGGFDQSRLVGDVSAQPVSTTGVSGELGIRMTDIGIGVAAGSSPFGNYTTKNGLLGSAQTAVIDPVRPYIYLPKATCDAITADLPVTYNESLGLYFWNTDDSKYKDITTSATYLSFSFYGNNTAGLTTTTIKVPFKLLDLTLQEPLVSTNTSYFPCFASDDDTYILGRAFLQAAFIGVNWKDANNDAIWFLAQAPGPGFPVPSLQSIEPNDTMIQASRSTWEQTWNGNWDPLGDSGSDSGLSTGAKAGIGVGCAIAGLILIGALAWVLALRRRRNAAAAATAAQSSTDSQYQTSLAAKPADPLIAKNSAPVELGPNAQPPQEAPTNQRYELG
ncbi:hypothetical protein ASPWEDRAFT_38679 [Aspergillus wentii DTO 134E9]|uniref:Peptidase A1 domain-containing protein n=1 Tax=Aspergillus wentii DTO 134E9 TaxID=1073089 RepID=A0A1L9RQ99_ASPWE|nr:uncharacterized protein ASPWEDRAFT_38679 [Aspergillus wentii DTO 134E9]KAI9928465.1 hypothetical protein MW887_002510 [Aspergillus wentii]OJJ37043.1 hypothetical protein ASPWEDRAFT_38679 [Aspergillus wentii DTO 134E9]